MSDETYSMLGREHRQDLDRQAANWRLAQEARKSDKPASAPEQERPQQRTGFFTLLVRLARASG